MRFMESDGGRSESFSPSETNDCTVVAVAVACGLDYNKAHALLRSLGRKDQSGFAFPVGRVRTSSGQIGDFWFQFFSPADSETVQDFIMANPKGTWILGTTLNLAGHVLCVKNGIVRDHTRPHPKARVKEVWSVSPFPLTKRQRSAR